MFLATLKNTLLSGLAQAKDILFLTEERALESLPEPYIPPEDDDDIAEMPEKLREKAARALHGPGGNPSQLGDPVSLKAELSETVPTPDEDGAGSSPSTAGSTWASGKETLRGKAAKKLHGPDANPSQLGDPISLEAEHNYNESKSEGPSAPRRDSKL
ncbi:hypothetical protein JX266_010226 [Neoarthrinium moseri]|nr:hypothetical protein JX266_010226 [Neoarthrinium moseri]